MFSARNSNGTVVQWVRRLVVNLIMLSQREFEPGDCQFLNLNTKILNYYNLPVFEPAQLVEKGPNL